MNTIRVSNGVNQGQASHDVGPGPGPNCLQGLSADDTRRCARTSDGGNGNHSVSLPIILIKIKVDQMLPSSYISSLLVSIL